MTTHVVMRSHNDMPLVGETLSALSSQRGDFDLVVIDNASSDGTREEAEKYTRHIVNVPAGEYVPGRVLNRGMEETSGDIVVFLNSDCTPQNGDWLSQLVDGFTDDDVAAVFGRQIPRPDCAPLHAKDTEDTYGDGSRQQYWKHCFSMASSAIRRSCWEERPFNEDIQYSEDIEWTWWARRQGYKIGYVPTSVVMHSHNYTLRQLYRRHYGEGRAEASIFDWSPWERGWLRYSLLPYGRQVLNDWKYALKSGSVMSIASSPVTRLAQLLGRRAGFKRGWKQRCQ